MPPQLTKISDVQEPEVEAPRPQPRRRRPILWVIVVLIIAALGYVIYHRAGANNQAAQNQQQGRRSGGRGGAFDPNRPTPVAVEAVKQQNVPVYLEGLGNVQAFYTVTLHSRVDGELMQVNFREGQQVRKGQELALIDPRPYEVAVSQAEATKYKDQANLENAQRDLQRYGDLYKQGVIAQQQYNTQQALVAQDEGAVRADDALINNAKLNLTYCHIKSPIDGRVGLRLVDPGNMVHASDPNGLIVITQLHPIAVLFTLPEDNLQMVTAHMQPNKALIVQAWSRDDTQLISTGRLETIDNQIDPNTGTFRLKGVFNNEDNKLYPNQFVNARLQVYTANNATTLPAAAVQHGSQGGDYVYIVKSDNTVESRPLKIAFTEGTVDVASSGVKAGELVVTDGQEKLQPGAKVQPQQGHAGTVAPSDQEMGAGAPTQ